MNNKQRIIRIWPFVVIGVILLAGFIVWDFAQHRRVEEYAATSPEIPGVGVSVTSTVEFASYRRVKTALTRNTSAGDIKVTVVWNSPEFFNALATAEGAQAGDITRHKTLYHAYAKKFDFHSDLIFTVVMESASVDLRGYRVMEKSLLRNDKGTEVLPWQWLEGKSFSARHLEGVLFFPQRNKAGERLIGHLLGEHLPGESPPRFVELVLKGILGGPDAVLRWATPEGGEGNKKE